MEKISVNKNFYKPKKVQGQVVTNPDDLRIAAHIRSLEDGDCADALLFDPNPEGAEHFGIGADSLIRDFDIKKGMDILEIGAGFGGLTMELVESAASIICVEPSLYRAEVLAERFRGKNNLTVYAGYVQDILSDGEEDGLRGPFDRIIIHDIPGCFGFERVFRALIDPIVEELSSHLKEDGELYLIADEDYIYEGNASFLPKQPTLFERKRSDIVLPIDPDAKRIRQVVDVQMDLLRKLSEVCEANGLSLFMIYGTLLGAVRHGGMIPGDDDIDMALPRKDYDRLMELADAFGDPYFLQMPDNDDCFFGGYLKLRNKNTTALHEELWYTDACEGIAIDIFPLDYGYDDREKEEEKRACICRLQRMLFAYSYGYAPRFRDMELLQWKYYKYLGKLTTREKVVGKLHDVMRKGDSKSKVFGIYAHYQAQRGTVYLDKEWFFDSYDMRYGDLVLHAPKGWHELLQHLYGPAYDVPQPWDPWKHRHGFYNTKYPYTYYKDRFTRLFRNPEKDLSYILVGDMCFFPFFEKDRTWANVTAYVQAPSDAEGLGWYPLNPKKIGKESCEKMREKEMSWDEFCDLEIDEHLTRVVIISANVPDIETRLIEKGIKDYLFYWVDRTDMRLSDFTTIWRKMDLYLNALNV